MFSYAVLVRQSNGISSVTAISHSEAYSKLYVIHLLKQQMLT